MDRNARDRSVRIRGDPRESVVPSELGRARISSLEVVPKLSGLRVSAPRIQGEEEESRY